MLCHKKKSSRTHELLNIEIGLADSNYSFKEFNEQETLQFCRSISLNRLIFEHTVKTKVIMQGKLIAVTYTLRTYWNQFSWAEFVNKNRYISVCLVSVEDKSI